jgi:glycosyltransferase involved in cell wall biosynthesis
VTTKNGSAMSELPLVTIVILSYNNVWYLAQAIQSALDQTYKNIQLIISDDGSTDASVAIIKRYQQRCLRRFVNYKFIQNKQNIGLVNSLNKAFKFVRGEYYCNLYSDDVYEKHKIKEQVRCFTEVNRKSKNIAYIFSDGYVIDEKGNKKQDKSGFAIGIAERDICVKQVNNNRAWDNYKLLYTTGMYLCAPSGMYKTKAISVLQGWDARFDLDDLDLGLRLLKKYNVYYLDKKLVQYRRHDLNYAERVPERYLRSIFGLMIREKEYCYANGLKDIWFDHLMYQFAYYYSWRKCLFYLHMLFSAGVVILFCKRFVARKWQKIFCKFIHKK